MARIRTIKPEFWTDGDMLKISLNARLFYIGLWNFSDDNGVMEYDIIALKCKIFPNDNLNVELLIRELTDLGKILPYEFENKRYLYIKNFSNHQFIGKPHTTKLPLPPTMCPITECSDESLIEDYIYLKLERSKKFKTIERQIRIENSYIDLLLLDKDNVYTLLEIKRLKAGQPALEQIINYKALLVKSRNLTQLNTLLICRGITTEFDIKLANKEHIGVITFTDNFEGIDNLLENVISQEITLLLGKDKIGKDKIGKDKIGKDKIGKDKIGKEGKEVPGGKLSDEDFLKTLKTNPVYKHINIEQELGKMDTWLSTHPGRQKTRRFVVNWLNKIDKPLETQKKNDPKPRKTCTACGGSGYLPDKAKCWCWE